MTGESGFFCGVDIGASASKLVLIDRSGDAAARVVRHSGVDYAETAELCFAEALETAGATREQVHGVVSTGYGRDNVSFADVRRTEIHCHGVGCYHQIPRAMAIIDIGGQDNKIIHLDARGRRQSFKMNRKCAAGTGAFIEEIALRLGLDVGALDALAQTTADAVKLSSFCTVFAKTEILAHLRQGRPVEGIIRGAFQSVIARVVEMDTLDGEVVLTGGVVAHNPTIRDILSERIGRDVTVPPFPQFTGALGAAVLALRDAAATETKDA